MSQADEMIETQLRRRGIRDRSVLDAMRRIPRDQFVPESARAETWSDAPIPIGFGQTITQPFMTALMAQMLKLLGGEKVLDVGTGSGYHTALLAQLAREVVSIERIPQLAELARQNLDRSGFGGRVKIVIGDGSRGFAEEAPYDAISVAASAPEVPPALIEQLRDPGTLVIPVGDRSEQDLCVIHKQGGKITSRVATACRFVPLIGKHGWEDENPK